MRIGVMICHCGNAIAAPVDCAAVAPAAREVPDVVFATDHMYACSDPGQKSIEQAIVDLKLDGVVVASCSPRMHEQTFRRAVERAGLNRYMFEMANIREHVAWVSLDRKRNTQKAIDLVRMAVEKLRVDRPLTPKSFEVQKRVLIVGGGVAGIQAALDCAEGGLEVVLVEKKSSIGGIMASWTRPFPPSTAPCACWAQDVDWRSTAPSPCTPFPRWTRSPATWVRNFESRSKNTPLVDGRNGTAAGPARKNAQQEGARRLHESVSLPRP
jgi:heterodisulfide reductase subunit A